MATFTVTINGQSATRTFPDAKALAVLSALAEAGGTPVDATTRQKAEAGLDNMLADAVTTARVCRKAQRIATATAEVDQEIGLG